MYADLVDPQSLPGVPEYDGKLRIVEWLQEVFCVANFVVQGCPWGGAGAQTEQCTQQLRYSGSWRIWVSTAFLQAASLIQHLCEDWKKRRAFLQADATGHQVPKFH